MDLQTARSIVGRRLALALCPTLCRATQRQVRTVLAVAAVACTAACGFSAPTAKAGAYGQQIELYAPTQRSIRVCGTNQFDEAVCHIWNTPSTHHQYYKLPSWWWIGTVTIQNFADRRAQHPLDMTFCQVPVRQRSNWTRCNGFSYPSSNTGLSNSRRFSYSQAHAMLGAKRRGVLTAS